MMRFFSGIRGGDKKKVSASALYKQKMSGKQPVEKTADEKYKEAIELKMQKMMEDAIMGKKKGSGFKMPGTKSAADEKPRELSKNAQMMLKLLAAQKLQKDMKKEKKKLKEQMWAEKAAKKAAAFAKAQKDAQEYAKRQEEDAAAAAAAAQTNSSWYSNSSDDNNGW